jgi:hypothetical protein
MACEGDELGVVEALADGDGALGRVAGGLAVSRADVSFDHGEEQVTLLDALTAVSLEEALCAAEPARRTSHGTAEDEAEADPERASNGAQVVVGFEVALVGTREHGEVVVVATEQVGGEGEALEIIGV